MGVYLAFRLIYSHRFSETAVLEVRLAEITKTYMVTVRHNRDLFRVSQCFCGIYACVCAFARVFVCLFIVYRLTRMALEARTLCTPVTSQTVSATQNPFLGKPLSLSMAPEVHIYRISDSHTMQFSSALHINCDFLFSWLMLLFIQLLSPLTPQTSRLLWRTTASQVRQPWHLKC